MRRRSLTARILVAVRSKSWIVPVASFVGRPIVGLLKATYRVRVVVGRERFEELLGDGPPAVFVAWHNRSFGCGEAMARRLRDIGGRVGILISRSRDGEIMARMADRRIFAIARGSTSAGGMSGVFRLHKLLVRERLSVTLAPDGPRGPVYECQPGAVVLAKSAAVPIVPMACSADRYWRLRSWDRMLLPKPFARVVVVVGEPLSIAADADLEVEAGRLQGILDDLVKLSETELGRGR
ncbi:MAG: DUF374 domain-containing protein [Thermoanaerobaculia bacterium]